MNVLNLADTLAFINDVLQSAIVIFGASIVLYNIGYSLRDRVTRSFTALVAFVIVVYVTELLVTHTIAAASAEPWLRAEWIGIANVPAAMFHLSDALLVTTGDVSRRRRRLVRVGYVIGILFLLLALFSDFLVGRVIDVLRAPHLRAGPVFPVFTLFYLLVAAASIYNVWRARKRCLIHATRQRMNLILASLLAAPLGVYPYLLVNTNPNLALPLLFWIVLIAGNLLVGVLFGMLTLQIIYFGAGSSSPERVVRVRLYKYMARVPLAATVVITVYVLVNRTSYFLGLPAETAAGFAIVATIILAEWAIHTFKRPLERLFQLEDDADVRLVQQLSERVLTTRELHDFLESVLAATCNALQTPTAFVVAFTPDGPRLERFVGSLETQVIEQDDRLWQLAERGRHNGRSNGRPLAPNNENNQLSAQPELELVDDLIVWQDYWIQPLYASRQQSEGDEETMLGLLGIRARAPQPNLSPLEKVIFARLGDQAAAALEDRILQKEVFAAVEGLLPQVTALQRRRNEAAYGGAPALTAAPEETPLDDPDFSGMVKDALSHYWGGPKLTESPLLQLRIVQEALEENEGNPTRALRAILQKAIDLQRPEGERSWTKAEWILFNILELKFVEGRRVRDVARRLAMSESDLYRKQRIAIEEVARTISELERDVDSSKAAEKL